MHCPLIVIGGSAGGVDAVRQILRQIGDEHECTMVLVLHRHHTSIGKTLTSTLQRDSRLPVLEVEDKMPIVDSHVYVAPADYHLLIERGVFSLSVDEKVNYSRPSIDVTLESAASSYGNRMVAVILTGANDDGSKGAKEVARVGGRVIVQDPAEAAAPVMPQAALAAVPSASSIPISKMIETIYKEEAPGVG